MWGHLRWVKVSYRDIVKLKHVRAKKTTLPVLVVEDQPSVRSFVVESLEPLASRVAQTADAVGALETIESGDFDVVVSDLYLPGATGLDLLAMAHQSQWDVTLHPDDRTSGGRAGDHSSAFASCGFLAETINLTGPDRGGHPQPPAIDPSARSPRLLRLRLRPAYSVAPAIWRAALRFVEANFQATLEALVAALDAREHETYAHSSRVRAYTTHLARLLGYPPALLPQLEHAALLHDIGKIAVSDAILLKPGKLTEEEWVEMRKHPAAGEQILTRVSFLRSAAFIVRHHHERFDGSGYPDGLAREQIPLGARIFAFADTLDAMTSDRRYRKAPGFDAVQNEVCRCIGTQFDPRVAEIFCRVPQETWKALRARVEQRDCPPPDPDPARRTAVPLVAEPRQAGG